MGTILIHEDAEIIALDRSQDGVVLLEAIQQQVSVRQVAEMALCILLKLVMTQMQFQGTDALQLAWLKPDTHVLTAELTPAKLFVETQLELELKHVTMGTQSTGMDVIPTAKLSSGMDA